MDADFGSTKKTIYGGLAPHPLMVSTTNVVIYIRAFKRPKRRPLVHYGILRIDGSLSFRGLAHKFFPMFSLKRYSPWSDALGLLKQHPQSESGPTCFLFLLHDPQMYRLRIIVLSGGRFSDGNK
jgi:hypothetical protein